MKYTTKAKWDKDGESFKAIHIIAGNYSSMDLRDEFRFSCSHEHDCCGCVSSYIVATRKLGDGKMAVITRGYRNI